MAMTLDDLRSQLSGLNEYVPEDEATLRQRATDIYSPQYQSDLNKLREQIEFQVGRQQRQAVGTGMQRSSYNSAQQASIRRGGLQSQADLSLNYESNIAQLLNDLLEKEKDRKLSADQYRNNLLLQLYQLENAGGSGGSGGSGSDSNTNVDKTIRKANESALTGIGQTIKSTLANYKAQSADAINSLRGILAPAANASRTYKNVLTSPAIELEIAKQTGLKRNNGTSVSQADLDYYKNRLKAK